MRHSRQRVSSLSPFLYGTLEGKRTRGQRTVAEGDQFRYVFYQLFFRTPYSTHLHSKNVICYITCLSPSFNSLRHPFNMNPILGVLLDTKFPYLVNLHKYKRQFQLYIEDTSLLTRSIYSSLFQKNVSGKVIESCVTYVR